MGTSLQQLEREVIELRRMVKELTQPKSKARVVNAASNVRFFRLREDVITAGTESVWGQLSDSAGAALGGYTQVVSWGGLLYHAQVDYVGLFARVDGEWVFVQGPCIEDCGWDGTITVGTPPDGTVDEVYAGHTVTSAGTTGLAITNLPAGLSATGGTISGTPTAAGTFYAVATAVDGTCTITRIVPITINEAA